METEPTDIFVVMVTAPNQEEAARIAKHMVQTRCAACATMVPLVESLYWWDGKLAQEKETLLLFKTTADKFPLLKETIQRVHPYKVPEVIAIPVREGLPQYLEWVRTETR